jgi:exodeoxyribonuclease III
VQAILLNIRHGGGPRAPRLLEWLTARSPYVVAMPEWRDNSAGDVLRRGLEQRGFQVATATLATKSNGVLFAAHRPFKSRCCAPEAADSGAMIVADFESEWRMLAAYFPQDKLKAPFFESCLSEAESSHGTPFLLLGDLNTGRNRADLEGSGVPFACTDQFEELQTKAGLVDLWRAQHGDAATEWSWYSPKSTKRRSNGFRIDHAFANAAFRKQFPNIRCSYDHTPREMGITDHSALVLSVSEAEIR